MKVYRVAKMRMSQKKMADVMYAIVMLRCTITSTFAVGRNNYTRSQNAYNNTDLMIGLYDGDIPKFEEMTGIKLIEQGPLTLN